MKLPPFCLDQEIEALFRGPKGVLEPEFDFWWCVQGMKNDAAACQSSQFHPPFCTIGGQF